MELFLNLGRQNRGADEDARAMSTELLGERTVVKLTDQKQEKGG